MSGFSQMKFKSGISELCNKAKEFSSMTGTNVVVTITDGNGTVLMDKAHDALESRKRRNLLEQEVNTNIPFESICTREARADRRAAALEKRLQATEPELSTPRAGQLKAAGLLSILLPKLELSTLAQTNKEYGAETHNVICERWRLSRRFVHLSRSYRAYKRVIDVYTQLGEIIRLCWDYTCPFPTRTPSITGIGGSGKSSLADFIKTLEHSTAPHKAVKGDFILSVVENNRLVPQKEPLSYLVKREENRLRRENSRKERMKYSF